MSATATDIVTDIRERVDALPWSELRASLDDRGHAITPVLLNPGECEQLSALFDGGRFRSTIDMARYRFGDGRYRYFDHPLPDTIAALRSSFYRHLAPIANDWSQLLRGENPSFPGRARAAPAAVRRGGAGAAHAADPALRGGRLERAPPGPLRRGVLPVPGADDPRSPGSRLRGRRVRAARAAAARAEPRPRADAGPGGVRDLPNGRAPQPRQERLSPRRHAPRRRDGRPAASAPRSA